MPPRLTSEALHLLCVQSNVLACWQSGAPNHRSIRRAVESGHWTQLTRRTFLASPGNPTEEQLEWAAVLHPGPGALMTGQHCLRRHGWNGRVDGLLHIVVPRNRDVPTRPNFAEVHRVSRMPSHRLRQGLPCVTPGPAVIHAAGWAATAREAMFIVISSLQSRIISPTGLVRALGHHPNAHRRAMILEVTREYAGGVTSMNERAFARLCRRFDVPAPVRQRRRKDSKGRPRYLDAEFRTASGATLIVEIDGIHHLDPQNWLDDIERHNALALAGAGITLRVSSWTLRYEPEVFMLQLREALANL